MKIQKILETIEKYSILTLVFLYPLAISTHYVNIFETPKLLLLSLVVSILTLVKILKIFSNESIEISLGRFDLFMLLLATVFLLSGILISPNKIDAFFLPANASFIVLSVITYFFASQSKEVEKNNILTVIIASIFTVSIIQILAVAEVAQLIPFLPEIIKAKDFSPLGNSINTAILSISIVPVLFHKIFVNKDPAEKVLSSLVGVVIAISFASSVYLISTTKNNPLFGLDYKTGWSVAVDSIKESPLLGVGPSNFGYSFNKYRPLSFNSQENWNLKYTQNTGQFLNILSEVGILGIVLIGYLCFLLYKHRDFTNPIYVSSLILTASIMILPASNILYLPLFVLIALVQQTKSVKMGHFVSRISKILISIPPILFLASFTYFASKAFYAEYIFSKAITSINNNQGLVAYDLANKAVLINPYVDRYHLFSSAVNMALAESLAQKENLTDEDRSNISRLIQQAIREGKASVAVNPKKSANWEALSDIYRTIIAFAQGSDVFAVESIKQAIVLDPINPLLRIKLGSLYYSLNQYDLAIESFKLAVLAKPDLPNAHYNLAMAYKASNQLDRAKEEINTTLRLLGKESADYDKAVKELQSIEELSQPTEKIEPAIEPQIDLPQEEGNTEPQI